MNQTMLTEAAAISTNPKPATNSIIAYFSMEIALDPAIPTYSGGLGMLAGDTIRSAAGLKVPMIGVTLLHRKGYFCQKFDTSGWQMEEPAEWPVAKFCIEQPARAQVVIEGRTINVRAWRYSVTGPEGTEVPVLLLDTNVPENSEWDRTLTDHLYGGDSHYRLCQEIVLGIGGVRMLRALGFDSVRRFHMNEGHAAMLAIELLDEQTRQHGRSRFEEDVDLVRSQCVFTTHTPVPAGHDRFPMDHVSRVLGRPDLAQMNGLLATDHELNLTHVALNFSSYVNGVAKKHREVTQKMFNGVSVDYVTNGVHLPTWAAPSLQALFDKYLTGWREDNSIMRGALGIPKPEVWEAHQAAKARLIEEINSRAQAGFDIDTLTLGFARRAASYKRATLLLRDPARLKEIARRTGKLQIVFAGKAHPRDDEGKHLIQGIIKAKDALSPEVRIVYLDNYDWSLAQLLVAGVDVWLNTPQPPMEASGTSGMKAALNGVPSLSILDGWWLEGWIENLTGWAIGEDCPAEMPPHERDDFDANSLYNKLEQIVIPTYYQQRDAFLRIMRHTIALNASHFNTQRLVQEYVLRAYLS